ncbi:bifunctional 2',3'-cyclic-nucleotide 2'-phosphodiesterase/3'-nucleotidase [Psychrosphaera aestuarii]
MSPTLTLRIMETTDIHMYFANYDYFRKTKTESIGFVNTATLIKEARSEVLNSVLIDNGDLLQNSPLGDYEAQIRRDSILAGDTHVAFKAMNLMNYDVANIGNHEFNFGLEFLKASIEGANFPYISANVYEKSKNDEVVNTFLPYLIKAKTLDDGNGHTYDINIGYIGFVPPQIMQWDKSHLEGKVFAEDIIKTAQKFVPEMKAKGADIVIAIPHSGLSMQDHKEGAENVALMLSKVPGIDAILFGHHHRLFPGDPTFDGFEHLGINNKTGKLNGVPAVMPGFFGNHLGLIDLELTLSDNGQWSIKESTVSVRAIASGSKRNDTFVDLAEADKAVSEAIKAEHEATIKWISESFAELAHPINSYFSLVQDDPSIQIVANAQIDWGKRFILGTELDGLPVLSAAAPFRAGRNGSEDFTYIEAGKVSLLDVVSLYVFPNTIRVIKLTGQDVKEWLERSAGQFNQIDPTSSEPQYLLNDSFPSFDFDVIDGVTYEIDITQPSRYNTEGHLQNKSAHRIVNLKYKGIPINLDGEFLVVTNNYRASGGGKFPNIDGVSRETFEGPDENRTVLRSYIQAQSNMNKGAGIKALPDSNWRFKPIKTLAKLDVFFTSSPSLKAQKVSENINAITITNPVRVNKDGLAFYQIDLTAN